MVYDNVTNFLFRRAKDLNNDDSLQIVAECVTSSRRYGPQSEVQQQAGERPGERIYVRTAKFLIIFGHPSLVAKSMLDGSGVSGHGRDDDGDGSGSGGGVGGGVFVCKHTSCRH